MIDMCTLYTCTLIFENFKGVGGMSPPSHASEICTRKIAAGRQWPIKLMFRIVQVFPRRQTKEMEKLSSVHTHLLLVKILAVISPPPPLLGDLPFLLTEFRRKLSL